MRECFIVTYQSTPLFAFDTRKEAEAYMQECINGQLPNGTYLTVDNFRVYSVAFLASIRGGK